MIEVRNLSKSYGDKMVVHDVSLKIQKGKITSLIGPNGAGKSTAFSMITRLMKRDGGQVFIEGKDIYKFNDDGLAIFRRRQIGLIYQFYNLKRLLY